MTIEWKGTGKSTISDATGKYRVEVTGDAVLIFSSIGFVTQEIHVLGRLTIDVSLDRTVKNLDEVIITALGIRKESKKLGYATTTVKTDQLTTNRTTNIGNSLQGKVAGVIVSPVSTGAGGSSKIRIRGISSFNGNNTPLIIVNGTHISNPDYSNTRNDNSTSPRGNSFADGGDGLISINPDDIETLTILKGATAAALYDFRV